MAQKIPAQAPPTNSRKKMDRPAEYLKKGKMLIAAAADNSGLLASAEAYAAAGAGSVVLGSINTARDRAPCLTTAR
jgi:hypothetical protein